MASGKSESSGWGNVFWGVVFVIVGIAGCIVFNKLEREGGSVRMPAVVILAYKMLGKWGVLAVFGGLGGLMTLMGLATVVSKPAPGPAAIAESPPTRVGDGP